MKVARVIVEVEPFHLDRLFDYLVPDGMTVDVGTRVEVVFSGRRRRGLVAQLATSSEVADGRLRPVRRALGEFVWVPPPEIELFRWAAWRFGGTVADVVRHALPGRTVAVERRAAEQGWFPPGTADRPVATLPPPASPADWSVYGAAGDALVAATRDGAGAFLWRPVPGDDVGARLVELVRTTLDGGRDALLVVPEPASAVVDAVVAALDGLVVDARGGPSPRRAYGMWLRARCGQARVVVGERGVALWPLARLGLAIVVDEANPALKERRSPRHHAREVALERARRARAVGLLVGTLPSAAAWRLLRERRLRPVTAERRVERRAAPAVHVAADGGARTRLSRQAMAALRRAVAAGHYGVVLAARRGEGRALVCSDCGERLACPACASSLSRQARRGPPDAGVGCLTCGWRDDHARCGACGGRRLVPLAAGAQRLGDELRRAVDAPVAVLEGYDQPAPAAPAVLVMTRGSVLDAPPGRVGAVVLPDLDGLLRRPGLDAAEDALRLALRLSAWTVAAGDARPSRRQAQVVVQTREPQHPAIGALVAWDPGGFWRAEARLRSELRFPPAAHAIRLELPAAADAAAAALIAALPPSDDLLGPLLDDGGAAYIVKSDDRDATLRALAPLRRAWSREGTEARLDVDPL